MRFLTEVKDALLHLAFPHICEGCGSSVLQDDHLLCLECLTSLPETGYLENSPNPVEKLFWGRLPLEHAAAHYYFTKESMMQELMHQFKYRGNKTLGLYLGRLLGQAIEASQKFEDVDVLVPLPLHPAKERKRGFNQSTILCEGIASVWKRDILDKVVVRTTNTETQTTKNRIERWKNMEGNFELKNPKSLVGKHVLLIDDVVTTGATLEACGKAILEAADNKLSVVTLCFSSGN